MVAVVATTSAGVNSRTGYKLFNIADCRIDDGIGVKKESRCFEGGIFKILVRFPLVPEFLRVAIAA